MDKKLYSLDGTALPDNAKLFQVKDPETGKLGPVTVGEVMKLVQEWAEAVNLLKEAQVLLKLMSIMTPPKEKNDGPSRSN